MFEGAGEVMMEEGSRIVGVDDGLEASGALAAGGGGLSKCVCVCGEGGMS